MIARGGTRLRTRDSMSHVCGVRRLLRVLLVSLLVSGLASCGGAPEPQSPRATQSESVLPPWAVPAASMTSRTLAPPVTKAPVSFGTDTPSAGAKHAKKIDLDLVSADIANTCRLIGELAGVNIVVGDGVTGTVTLRMRGVPWDQALEAICLAKGYWTERVGSVIIVRAK